LKREFGPNESEWWLLGVPKKVRLEVGKRFESDDGKRGTKPAYFELIDYRDIATERWDIFGPILGYDQGGNNLEVGTAIFNIIDQTLKCVATVELEPALAFISIGADDLDTALIGIPTDRLSLVFGGVFLMLRRHADIFSRS
jgi:hypothetical protein